MVHQVSCGPQQTLALCVQEDEAGKYTMVVQMGLINVMKEQFEAKCTDPQIMERGFFREEQLYMLEDIASVPFDIPISVPVQKVVCGLNCAAVLSSAGEVFTWGSNVHGELGLDQEKIVYVRDTGHNIPLKFMDASSSTMKRQLPIVDIAAGISSMVALADTGDVFVWGQRMGIYPTDLELTLACVEKRATFFNL